MLITADKYATADSSMKTELRVDASGKVVAPAPKQPAGDPNRRPYQNDHKRKGPMPTSFRRQVATIEDEQPEERPAPKKGGRPHWQPSFSYEHALDAPCKFHSGVKPAWREMLEGSVVASWEPEQLLSPRRLLGARSSWRSRQWRTCQR